VLALAGAALRAAAFGAAATAAAPVVADVDPARETVVETRLLPRATKQRLARLQSAARPVPRGEPADDPRARIDAARELIVASRSGGDPRLLGYAEAELSMRVDRLPAAAAVEVLVLRATVAQAQHRFDAARTQLDEALARRPDHPQALLTRAAVSLVQGRHAQARADCERLAPLARDVAAICGATVDAATGYNRRARRTLGEVAGPTAAIAGRAATRRGGDRNELRAWALSLAGEVAELDGDTGAAIRGYSASLAAGDDPYTRVALADALLAARQPQAARDAVAPAPPTDAVLLARWRAARALGDTAAATALESQLASRFGADAARGAPLHLREAAWFALERGDPDEALRLARANWADQRTPADALLLARAARAARDAATVDALRAWLRDTGLADARIERALDRPAQGEPR
jgi:Tfp pilus assembly protein PilF